MNGAVGLGAKQQRGNLLTAGKVSPGPIPVPLPKKFIPAP